MERQQKEKRQLGKSHFCIGLDLLGSDADSNIILESAISILNKLSHRSNFLLFGEEKNRPLLEAHSFAYQIAPESIEMDDSPLYAIRKKKNSSMLLGIRALKEKKINAFISMGNTGALVASARHELKCLPFIKHPALLALVPSKTKEMIVLDVGANSKLDSSYMLEFAAMGLAYCKALGVENPTLQLLNIGKEEIKGPLEIQKTHKALSAISQNYSHPFFQGNIEGHDVFIKPPDILLTDGFTGNIFLKTAEGMAKLLKEQVDSSKRPGAILAGVQGLVIKCHGTGKPEAFYHSLLKAIELLELNFLAKFEIEISHFLSNSHGFI
jgi:glycerol-3-phosphate acyltransferase PlsX